MRTVLTVVIALVVGIALGIAYSGATIRHLRKRVRELRVGSPPRNIIRSVTRFLFVTAQVFAIVWVMWSYVISTYSTVVLLQPFPAEELSREAVRTIIGVGFLKVLENVFEHNDGPVFGNSKKENAPPVEDGGEEGGVG